MTSRAAVNGMAAIHDYIENTERQNDPQRNDQLDPSLAFLAAMRARGVAADIAWLLFYDYDRSPDNIPAADEKLADDAESAVLDHLIEMCNVNRRSRREMELARKQAKYARKLGILTRYLESNLKRNLKRLDEPKHRGYPRPHYTAPKLSPAQNEQAETLWNQGATHGLSWHQARLVHARQDPAVYKRAHRIISAIAKCPR